jgi:hypothetical protein
MGVDAGGAVVYDVWDVAFIVPSMKPASCREVKRSFIPSLLRCKREGEQNQQFARVSLVGHPVCSLPVARGLAGAGGAPLGSPRVPSVVSP